MSQGLSQEQAQAKLQQFGFNQLIVPQKISFWGITLEEIREPMILLLLVVGFFYSLWGKLEDALTIFVVILLLVLAEVWNEYRAKKAISALSEIAAPKTKVWRDNKIAEIKTEEVVPGDTLILTQGTRISADSEILTAYSLQLDEAALTGESLPVEKKVKNEVFAGTLVVSGEGRALVLQTGKETKIGKISGLAKAIKPPKTPLQLAMKDLAKKMVWVALFFSITIPLIGIIRGNDLRQMILTGLALAFAVIPEELPIIITMILGLGSYKLSKENFLVKKIKAAETLGSATVILTDKTGTITQNKMQVVSVYPAQEEKRILETALLAMTQASLTPTDKAMIEAANKLGLEDFNGEIIKERSFSANRKTKSILRQVGDKLKLVTIGAPEEIFALTKGQANIQEVLEAEAKKGRRVIAIAEKEIKGEERNKRIEDLENNYEFLALISLADPPREGVKETILKVKEAGVRTIMVTGDHPQTAVYIAKEVGIPSDKYLIGEELDKMSDAELKKQVEKVSVFARTTPEHKYRIVKALQANKEVVAVTGDGVNDTLALKAGDIGIAMGIKGTDAAKEAADVILADDNYITISKAIFEARKFYDNLKKGVKYYLSVKTALVSIFLLPVILGIPLPFSPIQIILLELFMDLAASAGFVSEPAEKTIYKRKPEGKSGKILDAHLIKGILISGFALFLAVMISYFYAAEKGYSFVMIQTFAFTAWICGHIILAYVSRSEKIPLYKLGLFSNKTMNFWLLTVIIFLVLALAVPSINMQLKLAQLNLLQFFYILLFALIPLSFLELRKFFNFKKV